jgi:hypothetical protein
MKSEWKIFLEYILLEYRVGNIHQAINIAITAVKLHPGTGRLWAIYIQLCHRIECISFLEQFNVSPSVNRILFELSDTDFNEENNSPKTSKRNFSKIRTIRKAIAEVPKSGEVWCEKSRCHLNPLNTNQFDLSQAQRSLSFAVQFTPQYGDTFIEWIRLEMICQLLLPKILDILKIPFFNFINEFLSEDLESDITDKLKTCILEMDIKEALFPFERQKRRHNIIAIEKLEFDFEYSTLNLEEFLIDKLTRRYKLNTLKNCYFYF